MFTKDQPNHTTFRTETKTKELLRGEDGRTIGDSIELGRSHAHSHRCSGAAKWNQVISVMDGEDIWAMDPESNLYDKVILHYLIYQ
jgi:hypothetical protein